ncbi:MAG: thiol-disulfide isomerase [Proteobacteria bacterium]|nr:thiol-disulfide isomerase [Pseudomonadota bacterium]
MEGTLLVSYAILWVLVIFLSLLVFALARQVGVLHERVAPAGALMPTNGPKVGEMTEVMSVSDLQGDAVAIGGADSAGLATLILFVSPTCPVCKSLVPVARSLVSYEGRRMRLVFASDGDKIEQHIAYVGDLDIKDYPYVVSQALGLAFAVSKLPFAVLVGSDGTLKSKGLVNSREHLESLVEAMDSGVVSLQDYVEKNMPEFDESITEKAS